MQTLETTITRRAAANRRLAKVAVQFSADSFVVNQSLVLRINICAEDRHLRQAPKRWYQQEGVAERGTDSGASDRNECDKYCLSADFSDRERAWRFLIWGSRPKDRFSILANIRARCQI